MQPRTKRQKEVLDYVTNFIAEHGYEPSYQQIARRFRIASKSAIAKHITALEKQGLLLRQRDNGAFNLQIHPKVMPLDESVCRIEWLEVPRNSDFEDEWENTPFVVPRFLLGFFSPEKIFAFRVQDDSMIEDHICEGDVALIEKRSFARDGDSVVAILNTQTVVFNHFYREGSFVELRPANKNYAVLRLPADKVSVSGVFRSLLRPLD